MLILFIRFSRHPVHVGAPSVRRRRLSTLTRVDERYPIGQSAVVVVVLTLRGEFCNLNPTLIRRAERRRIEGEITGLRFAPRLIFVFRRHRRPRRRRSESLEECTG